ncbi:MAG: hypothetical protein AAB384_01105 [Patescibacteria group bacterium]
MRKLMFAICAAAAMVACGTDPMATGGFTSLPQEIASLPAPESGRTGVIEAELGTCNSSSQCGYSEFNAWLYESDLSANCVSLESSWCAYGRCKGNVTIDFTCSGSDDGCMYDSQCGANRRCYAGTCTDLYSGSCNDQDLCTYNDTYQSNGVCKGTRYTCNDVNGCTTDECYVSGGAAYCRNTSASCADNNVCTNDWCSSGGSCQHTQISNCCRSSSDCASGYGCSSNQCVWVGYGGGSGGSGNPVAIVNVEVITAPSFNLSGADFYGQFCSWGGMSNYATPTCAQSGFNRSWTYFYASAWYSENTWNRRVIKFQLTVPTGARTNDGFLIGSVVAVGNRTVWYPEKPSGADDVTLRFTDSYGNVLSSTVFNSNNGGYLVKIDL